MHTKKKNSYLDDVFMAVVVVESIIKVRVMRGRGTILKLKEKITQ